MGLGGQAASVRITGPVPLLNLVGLGVMAPVLDGAAVRAWRRQRARSAPSGSRRGWQRALGSGRPRGGLRWLGRRWTAPSALRLSLVAAKRPLPSVTGRRTSSCSSPTPATFQALVRCRGQGGGDGEQGDIGALSRSTTISEENDSKPLNCSLNYLNLTMTIHCRCSTERFGNEINFSGAGTW